MAAAPACTATGGRRHRNVGRSRSPEPGIAQPNVGFHRGCLRHARRAFVDLERCFLGLQSIGSRPAAGSAWREPTSRVSHGPSGLLCRSPLWQWLVHLLPCITHRHCPWCPEHTSESQAQNCGLTLRSTGRATAGHLGPAAGTLYIVCSRAKASRLRAPVSSTTRASPPVKQSIPPNRQCDSSWKLELHKGSTACQCGLLMRDAQGADGRNYKRSLCSQASLLRTLMEEARGRPIR